MSRSHYWQSIKTEAFIRDNWTCVKCGERRDLNYIDKIKGITCNLVGDHIVPIALGGAELDINNVQTLCLKCNRVKTNKDNSDIFRLKREAKAKEKLKMFKKEKKE